MFFWNSVSFLIQESDRAITPVVEAVHVPAHLAPPGSLQSKQLHHLHTQPSLGQRCHRQKKSCIYACSVSSVMSNSLRPCDLWPVRLLCQGGFFRQYWSVLANTGFLTLIEDYISYCPSQNTPLSTWCFQNPCDPSICTSSTPGPHQGRPKSFRAASGANPSG